MNKEHFEILKQGFKIWDTWRREHRLTGGLPNLKGFEAWDVWRRANHTIFPDLSGIEMKDFNFKWFNLAHVNLEGAKFIDCDFSHANLSNADLSKVYLHNCNFQHAKMNSTDMRKINAVGVNFYFTNFYEANLCEANLSMTNLTGANFMFANLTNTDLSGANLCKVQFVESNLENARLDNCLIYGISAWDLNLKGTSQKNLAIEKPDSLTSITVDDLEVAQFVYLLIKNTNIRRIIDTITSKAVLILGSFARKEILNIIREELRKKDYLPIVFDVDAPDSRDIVETIITLAGMSRFVIVDISNPRSVPDELRSIIPQFPSLAVQPLIHKTEKPYATFKGNIMRYKDRVLELVEYSDEEHLQSIFQKEIIIPTEARVKELRNSKAETLTRRIGKLYL